MLKIDVSASSEMAQEIGINAAIVVNKLNFWIEHTKYGTWKNGVKYIYNTYEQWQEQFSWMSLSSVKRVFKKLVDLGIIIQEKFKKGWDQTRCYRIDYSHPIVSKFHNPSCQNDTMEQVKMVRCYNTDTYPKKTANTTHVVKPKLPTDRNPYTKETSTSEGQKEKKVSRTSSDYPYAQKWLAGLDEIYKERVEKYIKAQMSNPKIRNPIGYEREVVSEVWRKHMGKENHCDFVVTSDFKNDHTYSRGVIYLTDEQKIGATMTPDEEMELLIQGGIYDG